MRNRVLVAWCPDWAVTAAGFPPGRCVAVVEANRVVVCSAGARAGGVRAGMLRREAQGRCQGLVVLTRDPATEARAFEPVVAAIATLTPAVEVTRPGQCALDVRGPARYFGGEEALCRRVVEVAQAALPGFRVGVLPGGRPWSATEPAVRAGVAEGRFAATLAARQGVIVAVGGTRDFLSPFPVAALERPDLADMLVRLGIRTLGDFAALPYASVLARFGPGAAAAHRLAAGRDDRRLDARPPLQPLEAVVELDPPAEQVDVAVAAALPVAEGIVEALGARGLACARLRIEAATGHGESMARTWRGKGPLGAGDMVQRLRWQLDGWLSSAGAPHASGVCVPTAGISMIRLAVDEVRPDHGHQLALSGGRTGADRRAAAGLDRLAGMLGPDAVLTGVLRGGRAPADRVVLVPWGEQRPARGEALPWPGHCPGPAPSLVFPGSLPAAVVDRGGEPVGVDARGRLSEEPARLAVSGGRWVDVVGWAGPWLADERWWDRRARRRAARMQVLGDDGVAHLLALEAGEWRAEATYD